MKVIIAGGGTGGHLYPGIAVAEKLTEMGIETLFMVSDRGIEREVLSRLGYNYVEQNISAFAGVSPLKKAKAMGRLAKSSGGALKYIKREDKVLLMGGFAAAPVAMAAVLNSADMHIHEQNSVMGLVNHMMATQARRVFLSYQETRKAPARSYFVGNPVRREFHDGTVKEQDERNILVVGGSGGSRIINMTVAQAAEKLLKAGYTLRHQTGRALYDETVAEYEKYLDSQNTPGLIIEPYIEDMAQAYRQCDVVVARSGSGTVFEAMYSRRPVLYIPFAQSANNHQYYNALSVQKAGYANLLEEKDLTEESLVESLNDMFSGLSRYKESLKEVVVMDSAAMIIKEMGIKSLAVPGGFNTERMF